jgi:hypothetical protein
MTRARMIRMRELVDDQESRLARERAVEIEFGQRDAAVLEPHRRQDLEPFEQRFGLGSAVQLDVADDHVDAVVALAPRRFEHRVALADAGRRAEKNAQPAALRARLVELDLREQLVGIGTIR